MRLRTLPLAAAALLAGAGAVEIAHVTLAVPELADDRGTIVHAESTPRLQIRTGCKIAALGVAPWSVPRPTWEIDTRRALAAMGVPAEQLTDAVARIRSGKPDEVVGFGNLDGLSSTGARYLPAFSTTFMSGETPVVCHGSMLRFVNPHRREDALVYHVGGYRVAVFQACGNVSRILPAPPGWTPYKPAEGHALAVPPQIAPLPALPGPATAPLPYHPGIPSPVVRDVPEPGAVALFLAGLAALIFTNTRKGATHGN